MFPYGKPDCLSCGRPMQPTRTVNRFGELPELRCYECRRCGLGFIEEYIAEPAEFEPA